MEGLRLIGSWRPAAQGGRPSAIRSVASAEARKDAAGALPAASPALRRQSLVSLAAEPDVQVGGERDVDAVDGVSRHAAGQGADRHPIADVDADVLRVAPHDQVTLARV